MNEKTGLPHPKLKLAASEIQAIFKKHDLGGFCVMFTDMQIEHVIKINPSFSLISLNETTRGVAISKPIETAENQEANKQKINATINMLFHLVRGGMAVLQNLKRAELTVRGVFGLDKTNGQMK